MALMAFAETETKVIKTLLPLVHSRHVQVSWQRGDTLLQQHRRHNTGELPNAHAHSGIEHCQGECKKRWYFMLSKAPLRSAWWHSACQASTARRGKPPWWPLPFVQRSEVIQSLLCLFWWRTRKEIHPHAMNSGRFPGVVRCSNGRSGTMAQKKTNILVADTSLSQHRVRPSSIKLKSFHFTSAIAVGGSPRSGATSLCMMALDGPNFHVWSKRQNCCSGPLLLTSWVSASITAIGRLRKVMASRKWRWRLSLLGHEHCKDENREQRCNWMWRQSSPWTDMWGIAPPSASGTETTLSGWGTYFMSGCRGARRAIGRRFNSWAE